MMLNIFLAINLKLDYNNIQLDKLIYMERDKNYMRLKLFDKRYNRNKDFLYWHVDICTDEHFVEDKLHDFHCQKKNIVNCFKIFSICNFTMDVAIAKNDTYESFEAELRKNVPGITHITALPITSIIK